MVTKVARVSARFSKFLARQRFLPNHEKVGSTTHRWGRTTKPHMPSDRLENPHAQDRHLGHGGFNLPGVVAAIGQINPRPGEAPATRSRLTGFGNSHKLAQRE